MDADAPHRVAKTRFAVKVVLQKFFLRFVRKQRKKVSSRLGESATKPQNRLSTPFRIQ